MYNNKSSIVSFHSDFIFFLILHVLEMMNRRLGAFQLHLTYFHIIYALADFTCTLAFYGNCLLILFSSTNRE